MTIPFKKHNILNVDGDQPATNVCNTHKTLSAISLLPFYHLSACAATTRNRMPKEHSCLITHRITVAISQVECLIGPSLSTVQLASKKRPSAEHTIAGLADLEYINLKPDLKQHNPMHIDHVTVLTKKKRRKLTNLFLV